MIVTLYNPNGMAMGDVTGTKEIARLKALRIGDHVMLRISGQAKSYEIINRVEVRDLGYAAVTFNGTKVMERKHHEHTLKLTVAPARKNRRK